MCVSLYISVFWLGFSLLCLRVDFLLETARGYPKDSGVTLFTLANAENPLRYNTLGQLYQSPPWPIPGDRARGKRRQGAYSLPFSLFLSFFSFFLSFC